MVSPGPGSGYAGSPGLNLNAAGAPHPGDQAGTSERLLVCVDMLWLCVTCVVYI